MPPVPVVVDVWTVPAPVRRDDVPGALVDRAVLDPAERARADVLPPDAAARFVLGRVLLRQVLATRLGCAPAEVALRAVCPRCGGPHGRVLVVPGPGGVGSADGPLHVGVTRSGPVVAVAVCADVAVGIDAESTSAVAAAPLADVALSPRERDRLARGWRRVLGDRSGAPGTRVPVRALARTWVHKEAALKALGTGLNVDPAAVEVRRPLRRARGVHAVVAVPGDAIPGDALPGDALLADVMLRGAVLGDGRPGAQVAVADLRLGRGSVGAVAVVAPGLVGPGETRTGAAARRLVVRRYDGVSTLSGRSS